MADGGTLGDLELLRAIDEGRDQAPRFVPRRAREQTEREERLRGALLAAMDDAFETRAHNLELCQLAVEARARAELAERALEEAVDVIVSFEARRRAGDVEGAVVQLVAWLERHGA